MKPEKPESKDTIDDRISHGEMIVNDVRLHYVSAGPSNGDLVVCLHGFPEFWYAWRHQIPALADAGYRVIAPDMRGYNRSEKPHGLEAYRLEELTEDVSELITELGYEQGYLVAHDWGGLVAWATAYSKPEVVRALTVLNAPHPVKYVRELSLEQCLRSWYVLWFQVPWIPNRFLTMKNSAALESVFSDSAADPAAFTDRDIERYRRAFSRPGVAKSALAYYRALFRGWFPQRAVGRLPLVGDRLAPPVPRVTTPTQVLWGEQDTALAVEQTVGLERYVDDLTVRRFPDASHWLHIERPDAVTESILEFFSDQHDGRY
ncbi:alpha/beta hydrolase [Halobacteria archaeon AArc-curdl1]|uniref:Alpha/beta hydrolase n=1 Tax=Natronosalvus hydrolyticus TaxID=2979988 RepID=A0AAP2Z528_9EURY|nr:alpha/beta hydrolase [Halobacteria archaeon AArc-curdl1]